MLKKFWFFWILNCWNLPHRWGRKSYQAAVKWFWDTESVHKCWPLHTAILPPAFFFAWSYCPKHLQLPSFVQSLRTHLFLMSLQLELRTSRYYHDAQDLGWKVTASVNLLSQCKKLHTPLSVAGERLPWQRLSHLAGRGQICHFEGADLLALPAASWAETKPVGHWS